MRFLSDLEQKLVNLIPKRIRDSQIFFFGLLILMLPVTIFFSQQFKDVSLQRIASESITPLTPPSPTHNGENACNLLSANKPNGCSCQSSNQCASGFCNINRTTYDIPGQSFGLCAPKPTEGIKSTPTPTSTKISCDLNGDGKITFFEAFYIISCFNKTSTFCKQYDFNKDGKINTADYNMYLRSCR